MKIQQLKQKLIFYFIKCKLHKYHEMKHVADEYEIKRNRAFKAYKLGEKLYAKNNKYL